MKSNFHIKLASKIAHSRFLFPTFWYRELDLLHSLNHSFTFAGFRQPASLSFFRSFGIFSLLSARDPILAGLRVYTETASGLHGKIHGFNVLLPIAGSSVRIVFSQSRRLLGDCPVSRPFFSKQRHFPSLKVFIYTAVSIKCPES